MNKEIKYLLEVQKDKENKQITIQIKSIFGKILFEYTKLNNTVKDTLEVAVKNNVNLSNADLRDANLSNADLSNAILRYANLSNADLSNAILRYANLLNADLYNANLSNANLSNVHLSSADLSSANLSNADLSNAILRYANLLNADLSKANLSNAILSNANLRYANLSNAEKIRKGVIIDKPVRVFKKCIKNNIVELELLKGSIVFSINNKKCRTNKAKVISINGMCEKGLKCCSSYSDKFIYEVGKMVEVKDFDLMYNVECSSGIHFFWTKEEAEDYDL